jgi:hypothetical protein
MNDQTVEQQLKDLLKLTVSALVIEHNIPHHSIAELVRSHILNDISPYYPNVSVLYAAKGESIGFCNAFNNVFGRGQAILKSERSDPMLHEQIYIFGLRYVTMCPILLTMMYHIEVYPWDNKHIHTYACEQQCKEMIAVKSDKIESMSSAIEAGLSVDAWMYQNCYDIMIPVLIGSLLLEQNRFSDSFQYMNDKIWVVYDVIKKTYIEIGPAILRELILRVGLLVSSAPWCKLDFASVPGIIDWHVIHNGSHEVIVI